MGVGNIKQFIPKVLPRSLHSTLLPIRTSSLPFSHPAHHPAGQVVGLYSRFDVIVSVRGERRGAGGAEGRLRV